MKLFYILLLTIILLPCPSKAEEERLRTITVQGEAQKEFSPDIAKFSVNIIGQATTGEEAKNTHDKSLKSLMELIKKYNIDDKDLSTGYSSVNPNYEYPNGKRKFINYTAQTQLDITLRDLKIVGKLQDSLISSGFDNFQGPNYTIDKIYTYNALMLASAVENAKEKATSIAKKLNETIDKPIDIKEDNIASSSPIYFAKAKRELSVSSDAVIQPAGVITIKSGVVATFSLK